MHDLARRINILAEPTRVFEEITNRPAGVLAFLVVSSLSIAVAFFSIPFSVQANYALLSGQFDDQIAKESLKPLERLLSVIMDAAPVRFSTLFSGVVHSEMIPVLMSVVNVLIFQIRGLDGVHHATDLQVIAELDFVLTDRSANLPLFVVLNSINVFSAWYVGVLSIGVSVMTGFGKLKSATLVTAVWLLGLGFQVALAAISSMASAGLR